MPKPKTFYQLARPFIFKMDPEKAHQMSLKALKMMPGKRPHFEDEQRLNQTIAGLSFANPLGMAPGYDKNGDVISPLQAKGFGFVEVGTVTPLPQTGNKKPRLFRLEKDQAIINRMGFNNAGLAHLKKNLQKPRSSKCPVGANIGANKDSTNRIDDYVKGLEALWPYCDYFTVNISSPNTPGLRDLQAPEQIRTLLKAVNETADKQAQTHGDKRPIFIKLAPDIHETDCPLIFDEILNAALDGVIISNTTISRPGLPKTIQTKEAGGLSGRPLFELSTKMLAVAYGHMGGQIPLIGVGGIDSAQTAIQKLTAGASLIQIYSSLVFKGPCLISEIITGIIDHMKDNGQTSISELTGKDHKKWLV